MALSIDLNISRNNSFENYQWPFLGLFIIPICTIWGNALVCVSVFIEKRLQNRFNFFLVSLAISDLLCALLVMPVSAWNMVRSNDLSNVPRGICLAWYSLDVFFTSTTIIHLCSISLDRYFVLNNPLKYHNTRIRSSLPLKISIAWLIPFCIACPLFMFALHLDNTVGNIQNPFIEMGQFSNQSMPPQLDSYKGCGPHNVYFIIISTVTTFVLPLCIMIVTYILTVWSIIRQTNQARQNLYPDKTITKSRPHTHIKITDDSQSINETTNSAENVSYSLIGVDEKYCSHSSLSINSFDSPTKRGSFKISHKKEFKIHLNVPTMEIRRSFDFSPKSAVSIKKQSSLSEKSFNSFNNSFKMSPSRYTNQLSIRKNLSNSFRIHKQSRNSAKRTLAAMNSGKKAVQVLGILFGLFLLCYLPFFVIYLLDFFCTRCQSMTGPLVPKTEWIGYSASMLNPIVYHIFNPTFRNTFNRLMRCKCYKVRKAFSANTKSYV